MLESDRHGFLNRTGDFLILMICITTRVFCHMLYISEFIFWLTFLCVINTAMTNSTLSSDCPTLNGIANLVLMPYYLRITTSLQLNVTSVLLALTIILFKHFAFTCCCCCCRVCDIGEDCYISSMSVDTESTIEQNLVYHDDHPDSLIQFSKIHRYISDTWRPESLYNLADSRFWGCNLLFPSPLMSSLGLISSIGIISLNMTFAFSTDMTWWQYYSATAAMFINSSLMVTGLSLMYAIYYLNRARTFGYFVGYLSYEQVFIFHFVIKLMIHII